MVFLNNKYEIREYLLGIKFLVHNYVNTVLKIK